MFAAGASTSLPGESTAPAAAVRLSSAERSVPPPVPGDAKVIVEFSPVDGLVI